MATILVDKKRNERVARQYESIMGDNIYKRIANYLNRNPNENLRIYNIQNCATNRIELDTHFDFNNKTQDAYLIYGTTYGSIFSSSCWGSNHINIPTVSSTDRNKMFIVIMDKNNQKPFKPYRYIEDKDTRYIENKGSIVDTHRHDFAVSTPTNLDKSGYDLGRVRNRIKTLVAYRCQRTKNKLDKLKQIEEHVREIISSFIMIDDFSSSTVYGGNWNKYTVFKALSSILLSIESATKARGWDTYKSVQQRLNGVKSRIRSTIKWVLQHYRTALNDEQVRHLEQALEV